MEDQKFIHMEGLLLMHVQKLLNMYVKTLGRELNKFNIHVSAILPGPILTENKHWDKLQKKIRNFIISSSKNLCRLVKCLKSKKSFQL